MRMKAIALAAVCVVIAVAVFLGVYVFRTPTRAIDPYAAVYYGEFNATPAPAYNYSFSPPVSMYHALVVALKNGGWTAASLENMTVGVELDYCAFGPLGSFTRIRQVTSPPAGWSPRQVNETTCRYVWTVIVRYPGRIQIPPPGYYFVDAATAEVVPVVLL